MERLFVIICFILQLALAEDPVPLSAKSDMKFPHFMGNLFSIQIASLDENMTLSTDATDTMIIRITDLNFTEIERASLIYGVQDFMDDEFNGKYMDIKVWEKNPSSTKMNISIMFKRNAHRKYLEIFYFSAPNKFHRKKYLKNLFLAKRLFHEMIELFIPYKLSISVNPINVDRNEIINNDLVLASCRAFDGVPQIKPKFDNHLHLNVTDTKYNEKNNEIKMYFRVTLEDHLTNFSCFAGNVTKIHTIRISHHPSKVFIKPKFNEILLANTTIHCYSQDGYPEPEINFLLIEGPSNASLYYETRRNGSQIYINSHIPIGSAWKFKCSIKSTIVNITNTITEVVEFKAAGYPTSIVIKPMANEILESNSTIECAPADGYPTPTVYWEIVMSPVNSSIYYNILHNKTRIYFNRNSPTKSEWKIKCVIESCIENICKNLNKTISFTIANHPTKLYIHPIIKKRFRSNSTIKCLTIDGYPYPEINWYLIEGPQNAESLYNITGNGLIHINSNTPIGSKWKFICIMKNNLTNTQKILNKTISFLIAKNPMKICDEKCLNSRMSEVEESVEENNKLHDDMKFLINTTNQIKKQMDIQKKELERISNKLNDSFRILYKSIELQFHFLFEIPTIIPQNSPKFISKYPLIVQFWIRTHQEYYYDYHNNNYHRSMEFGLIFSNVQLNPVNIDLKYKCLITGIRSRSTKFVIFDIKFRGSYYKTEAVTSDYSEIFGPILDQISKVMVSCFLMS